MEINFLYIKVVQWGGNYDKKGNLSYPTIGNNVRMYSNSSILGNSIVGNNVLIAAGACVINSTIPDNSIVFGESPNLLIKTIEIDEMFERQKDVWEKLV